MPVGRGDLQRRIPINAVKFIPLEIMVWNIHKCMREMAKTLFFLGATSLAAACTFEKTAPNPFKFVIIDLGLFNFSPTIPEQKGNCKDLSWLSRRKERVDRTFT